MVKKKILTLCCALLLALLAAPGVAAEGTTTYPLEELGLQIEVPEDMYVLTRDSVSDEQAFREQGADIAADQQSMVANNAYLNAFSKDFGTELVLIMLEDDATRQAGDFSDYGDAELAQAGALLAADYEAQGVDTRYDTTYRAGPATYIVLELEIPDSYVYGRQYCTDINGREISLTLWSYTGGLTDAQRELQTAAVDSIKFDAAGTAGSPGVSTPAAGGGGTPASATTGGGLLSGISPGVIGGLGGAVVVAIALPAIIRAQAKKSLAPCRVDGATFAGETFTYKGELYDRGKYIEARMKLLRSLGKQPGRLEKQREHAEKKARSGGPAAVLDQLEIEAITRLLAGG